MNKKRKPFHRVRHHARKIYVRLIDTPKRSLVKSVTWRIIGIVILGLISWFFTRDIKIATEVTILFHLIRFILYYFHERIWEHVRWGEEEEKL